MPGYPWTEDEKNLLRELTAHGNGAIRIGRLGHFVRTHDGRGRTVDGIAQQIRRMNLANPQASARSRRARKRPPLSPQAVGATKAYLRLQGADIPIWHVCEKFGVTESWVRGILLELGIKRSWKASVAHPLSKFKSLEFRRAVALRVRAQVTQRMHDLLLQMKQSRNKLLGQFPGTGQRACDQCNEPWPLTEEFFQGSTTGKKIYFLYACRVCAAARRREVNRSSESPRTRRLRLRLAARRQDVLTNEPAIQTKNCRACWKAWPLTLEFWRGSPTKTGHLCFDPRCRLCQNAKRREARKERRTRQKSIHWVANS
jgi:hypothetical protein